MNGTLQALLIGIAAGGTVGACSGLLLALMQSWSKDLRDARLRRRGHPLPSDRVFARHYILAVALVGAGVAGWFVGVAGLPLLPAALGTLVLPALRLILLIAEWCYTILASRG